MTLYSNMRDQTEIFKTIYIFFNVQLITINIVQKEKVFILIWPDVSERSCKNNYKNI